jgi:GNAT superfamily N-acetyltransferase
MPELTYRAATPADLPFIITQIVDDSVVAVDDDPADATSEGYLKALAAIDADPNQEMFVVELDGERVGCFHLTYIPGLMRRGMWRGLIEVVHVVPERRNGGVGTAMMRWALDRCRDRGCGMAQLTSNKARIDAHRFYERLGFAKSHEGFRISL